MAEYNYSGYQEQPQPVSEYGSNYSNPGPNDSNQQTEQWSSGSSYVKTEDGYYFPGHKRSRDYDRDRGGNDRRRDRDRQRSRRRRSYSRSRSRSNSRDRSRSRDRSSRNRDRSRDRGRYDRDRDRRRDRSRDRDGGRYGRRSRFDEDSRGSGRSRDDDRYGNRSRDESFNDNRQESDYGSFEQDNVQTEELDGDKYDDDGNKRINGKSWKDRLTSIREAHFNRSKQAPSTNQNQFSNDGSFMEMFRKKMQESSGGGDLTTPNSLVMASKSIPFAGGLSLPPLTTNVAEEMPGPSGLAKPNDDEDVDGVPMVKKALPMPVSVGKRRMAKPLKTGIVAKKPQNAEEGGGGQEQLDAWARYLQEVQKYKSSKCIDDDPSRPLVK